MIVKEEYVADAFHTWNGMGSQEIVDDSSDINLIVNSVNR